MNSGLKSFLRTFDHFSCYSLEAILPYFFMGNLSKTNNAIICKLKQISCSWQFQRTPEINHTLLAGLIKGP